MSGVTFAYGEGELRREVLRDVSLAVAPGEIVLLTGPSGSGKTTLLTLIGALRAMQEGSARVLGQEMSGASEGERVRLRRRIGFIFQNHNLLGFLSARENVAMALELDGALTEAQRRERAGAMLAAVGLADHTEKLPAKLSGGQRQRVAVARALVGSPGLILAHGRAGQAVRPGGGAPDARPGARPGRAHPAGNARPAHPQHRRPHRGDGGRAHHERGAARLTRPVPACHGGGRTRQEGRKTS
jgi:putative ABC transport system ATP-binding protein